MPRKKTSKRRSGELVIGDYAQYFFIVAILITSGLFLWVISPFFNILIYSTLVAVVFHPLQKLLLKLVKRPSIAALLTTLVVVLLVLVPLTLFVIYLVQEAVNAYSIFGSKLNGFDLTQLSMARLEELPFYQSLAPYIQYVQSFDIDVINMIRDLGRRLSNFIVDQGAGVVATLTDSVIGVFIFILTTFYFLRDGKKVTTMIKDLSPIPRKYEEEIQAKLKEATHAIVMGSFGTAFVQGMVAMIGYLIAGVDSAIFWGTITIFGALVPYVGPAIIYLPISIALAAQGEFFWAGFVAAWGFILVSLVDNLVRPYLIGSGTAMHPLATFLSVLGGIFVFGAQGIIFGPLVLSLALTMIHIYQLEYGEMLKG